MPPGWIVEERVADAGTLHAAWPAAQSDPGKARVGLCRATTPALVLGSTQPDDVVDHERAHAAGVTVTRRRSGGGAVLVAPGEPAWIDVWLPAAHPLWRRDATRAFDWLGDVWVAALAARGINGLAAHRQGFMACTRWSRQVCFGGVGTGEVVTADRRKVVGLAQRRNRDGVWFHGACIVRWDPVPLVGLLVMPDDEREAAIEGLTSAVVGAADLADAAGVAAPDRAALASSFIAALPEPV